MKKKLLALLLCVAMLLPSIAYAAPLGGINFSASAVKDLVSAAADEVEEETPVVEEPVVEEPVEEEPTVEETPVEEPVVEEKPVESKNSLLGKISAATVKNLVDEVTYFETVMAAETVEEMYIAFCADQESATALSADELDQLIARATELKNTVGDPTGDYDEFVETLEYLKGEVELEGEPEVLVTTTNSTWQGGRITTSSVQELGAGATVTLRKLTSAEIEARGQSANFVVPSGVTFTLKGYGTFARASDNTQALIYVEEGGTLIIEGTSKDQPLIIDGKNVIASAPLIVSSGTVKMTNAVIQNGKNRLTKTNTDGTVVPNGQGGGITVGSTGSLTMNNCIITRNTASLNGGGICSSGPVTATNCEISWNRAASPELTGSVNAGRGGGFAFSGENGDGVFTNVLVTENAAMYYGGGGQISGSGSSLIMNEGTVFSKNEAILHGAGALHITGDATFTMNGGSMENNKAQYVGGAIHSSYSCTLNLIRGTIKDNICNGRGAGIHINTGGAITLSEGIVISGNRVYTGAIGTYCEMDATGDTWWGMKYEGANNDFGYGGGVMIDSGTCTVAGATITNNYAEVGGGGIALTMLNMHDGGLDDLMVNGFEMTSGTVSNNTTDGDGAGVYIMTNKAKENFDRTYGDPSSEKYKLALIMINGGTYTNPETKKETEYDGNRHGYTAEEIFNGIPEAKVSGGTIQDNVAQNNGGGLYLGEKTKFEILGTGIISSNEAVNGGGAYVESGTAFINGGSISGNDASQNGGGLYISGTVTMTAGTVTKNEAVDGGGAYVSDGDFTMTGGTIVDNDVPGNGGGLYVTGGDFTMISGTLRDNDAIGTTSYGGGAYVTGGNVYIGAENCGYNEPNGNHDNTAHDDKTHPVITNNTAEDSGGGLAVQGTGNITMYCGKIYDNDAPNRGRGWNVYMENGIFTYKDGTMGGNLNEPELVIVGGTLDADTSDTKPYITLEYNHCNGNETHEGELSTMTAAATKDSAIHLPDGEKYWDAADGYRFFGWTFYGPNDVDAKKNVRTKLDYKELGAPITVKDDEELCYDGIKDGKIQMYALWAPDTSDITYAAVISNTTVTTEWTNGSGNPATYDFYVESHKVTIRDASKPGYAFRGWYIYQDLNQNANWGYEPVYKNGGTGYADLDFDAMEANGQYLAADGTGYRELEMGTTFFGDITLVADFEPAYTDLIIDKDFPVGADYSIDANQVFVFEISGEAYDPKIDFETMTVMVVGDGDIKIANIPVGAYTVTEKSGWSWRYGTTVSAFDNVNGTNVISGIELKDPDREDYKVTFTNTRTVTEWLNGSAFAQNIFKGKSQ